MGENSEVASYFVEIIAGIGSRMGLHSVPRKRSIGGTLVDLPIFLDN